MSDAKRPAATREAAEEIQALPAGLEKVKLAYAVCSLATEGDQGQETIQAVADTLAGALKQTPVPAKQDELPMPYMELASLARYRQAAVKLDDPLYGKAMQKLADEDAAVEKADFTLKDLHGKKVTLSELRGKIVMVNFWATWCPPCRREMPDLDALQRYFAPQGLVIVSITDEDPFKVGSFIGPTHYTPDVLLDPGDRVHKEFHVYGIPKTFVFNRDGKLIGETIDESTRKQFLALLSKTDLHP
ncbi:MAG TPA: TlpA disulfide reductase family protein [Terracidiphilus sp.]|nr:TlpA disulfide reductase family protein [Terracidiphilus sp.]